MKQNSLRLAAVALFSVTVATSYAVTCYVNTSLACILNGDTHSVSETCGTGTSTFSSYATAIDSATDNLVASSVAHGTAGTYDPGVVVDNTHCGQWYHYVDCEAVDQYRFFFKSHLTANGAGGCIP